MRSSRRAMLIATTAVLVLAAGAVLGFAAPAGDEEEGRPWLGVALMSNEDEATVRIAEVFEESPAEDAGIRDGDAVVSVDGKEVHSAGDLVSQVGARAPGERLELLLENAEGERRTVVVTLGERPEDFSWSVQGLAGLEALEGLKGLEGLGKHFLFDCEGEDCEHAFLLAGEGSTRSYLGVELTQPSDQLREFFGAGEDEGILVNRVLKGSPADHAGLRAGDLIVALEGEAVAGSGDLIRALRAHEPGETVDLSVLRDRSRQELRVELGENPHREIQLERFYRSDPDGARLDLLDQERLREIEETAAKAQQRSRQLYEEALAQSRLEERLAEREGREAFHESMRLRELEGRLPAVERERLERHLMQMQEELQRLREGLEEEHLKLLRFREEMPGLPEGAGRNLLMA